MGEPPPLRLLAEDPEDLLLMSAALQDAVGKIGDIAYDARARRVTLTVNRYRWESTNSRVRSVLQVGSVTAVRSRRLRRGARDAVVELLALNFVAREPPGGVLTLGFAGGGDMEIEVECVDAILADISVSWPTIRRPAHSD